MRGLPPSRSGRSRLGIQGSRKDCLKAARESEDRTSGLTGRSCSHARRVWCQDGVQGSLHAGHVNHEIGENARNPTLVGGCPSRLESPCSKGGAPKGEIVGRSRALSPSGQLLRLMPSRGIQKTDATTGTSQSERQQRGVGKASRPERLRACSPTPRAGEADMPRCQNRPHDAGTDYQCRGKYARRESNKNRIRAYRV
jgi:hypothetical protein